MTPPPLASANATIGHPLRGPPDELERGQHSVRAGTSYSERSTRNTSIALRTEPPITGPSHRAAATSGSPASLITVGIPSEYCTYTFASN